jgi:HlyD family secretion protein
MKKIFTFLVMLALAGGGATLYYWKAHAASPVTFKTATAAKGPLVATISSTGTLEPLNVIDVGAQVSGMVEEFGKDPNQASKVIDYGSQVDKGTVLAVLDKSLYKARVDQAQANLDRAKADLKQMQAALYQAERDWKRAENMVKTKAISDSDYDLAEATYVRAKANVGVGRAAIEQAVHALKEAQINLGYCTIVSKAKGVIIDRRVNIGQTVVSSLNAPSLFLIATDLSKMQVWASVNEADIGQIKPGQLVRFTVDTFPERTFEGKVGKVRLNASMTQNVVTYTVEVDVDNQRYGNILKPYLTTNLQFVVDQKPSVLQVPNAALRWRPQPNQVAPDARKAYEQARRKKQNTAGAATGTPGANASPAASDKPRHNRGTVWVVDGDFVRPVRVTVGLSDGTSTEILAGLKEGQQVVIGEEHQGGGGDTSNPFAPKLFGGKKPQ